MVVRLYMKPFQVQGLKMDFSEEAYMPKIEEGASPEKTSLEKARGLQPLIQARVFSDMQQAFGTATAERDTKEVRRYRPVDEGSEWRAYQSD